MMYGFRERLLKLNASDNRKRKKKDKKNKNLTSSKR